MSRTQNIGKIERNSMQTAYTGIDDFNRLVQEINRVNSDNDLIHRRSLKWLWCLVAGFALQLLSAIVGSFGC